MAGTERFDPFEATIEAIHAAFAAGRLTARGLVDYYLDRIARFDQAGPAINAMIAVNAQARAEADRLDAAFQASGPVGPLHGIPVAMKDQGDVAGMATTLGSLVFKDFTPDRDCFVVERLRQAGAIVIGKTTLGELGGGDTHGSLFGSTRNPYDTERTVGGSSGGTGAAVSANFAAVGIGQEGFASIRRPSIWNGIAGMRPTAGLVSRAGVYAGWPSVNGSLGPMARSVADLARILDVIVGYDPEDPITARGYGRAPQGFAAGLDRDALKGARIGVVRQSIGFAAEPDAADFKEITGLYDGAIATLASLGAEIVDPIGLPDGLMETLAKRASSPSEEEEAFRIWMARSRRPAFADRAAVAAHPDFAKVVKGSRARWVRELSEEAHGAYLKAREALMTDVLKLMADHRLDAIVHKAVEHVPTLIRDGVNPPFVDQKGVPYINTFLVYVPSIVVPAGFTSQNLPAGITFLGRPYDDARMVRFAYAYEQATNHRRPPPATP